MGMLATGPVSGAFLQGYFFVRLEASEAGAAAGTDMDAASDSAVAEGDAPEEIEAWVWRAVPVARSGAQFGDVAEDGLEMAAPNLGADETEEDSLFAPTRRSILDDAFGRDLEPPPF